MSTIMGDIMGTTAEPTHRGQESETESSKARHRRARRDILSLRHRAAGCPVCDPVGYARVAKHRADVPA